MNPPITFECPHCHELNVGDESMYGQRVDCQRCRVTMLVPSAPAPVVGPEPQTARLVPEPTGVVASRMEEVVPETEIFRLSPVARAYLGQILLGLILIGVAVGLTVRAEEFSWPHWVALVPLALGLLVLLLVWIMVKSSSYRLTNPKAIRPSRLVVTAGQ